MAINEIRIDDRGYIINITVKDETDTAINLSAVVTKQIILRKPDGSAIVGDLSFVTDGTDGQVRWWTSLNVFNIAGDWQFQVYLAWAQTDFRSDIQNFTVHPNLPTS